MKPWSPLYLIEILHQTTTKIDLAQIGRSCILLKFYIKPQLVRNYYGYSQCCILLKFYIKPQLFSCYLIVFLRCILLKFYIKPQQKQVMKFRASVVSYWNSTSNHNIAEAGEYFRSVVSYWNSTSNHNILALRRVSYIVVSYWNSTSNHNSYLSTRRYLALYLIEILHQTTTQCKSKDEVPQLYLIEILHQTTTSGLILIDKVLLTGCLPL